MKGKLNQLLLFLLLGAIGILQTNNVLGNGPMNKPLMVSKSDGNLAIGIRAGGTGGITLKQYRGNYALEGILGVWGNGMSFTGLYEFIQPLENKNFHLYYGFGGHLAVGYSNKIIVREKNVFYVYRSRYPAIGIDGIVGIEARIPNSPVALSIDVKPLIELGLGDISYGFTSLDPGIGVKIIF